MDFLNCQLLLELQQLPWGKKQGGPFLSQESWTRLWKIRLIFFGDSGQWLVRQRGQSMTLCEPLTPVSLLLKFPQFHFTVFYELTSPRNVKWDVLNIRQLIGFSSSILKAQAVFVLTQTKYVKTRFPINWMLTLILRAIGTATVSRYYYQNMLLSLLSKHFESLDSAAVATVIMIPYCLCWSLWTPELSPIVMSPITTPGNLQISVFLFCSNGLIHQTCLALCFTTGKGKVDNEINL